MGFNTGVPEDDVEELRRGYEVEIGGLESELATLRRKMDRVITERNHAEVERNALRAQLEDFHASQHYRYIGADGKTVLARDLEDERDALRAENERLRDALTWYSERKYLEDFPPMMTANQYATSLANVDLTHIAKEAMK